MTEQALKRIEEKYVETEEGITLFREGYYSPRPATQAELDMRKLARALALAGSDLSLAGFEGSARQAERTLKEVSRD